MHISSYNRISYLINWYRDCWDKKEQDRVKILDIGSCDQNGSQRGLFADARYVYTGLDLEYGPNVDIVLQDAYAWSELNDNSYDLVISGQAFEHIEYPWLTIKEIARVMKPGGLLIVIAPSSGYEHKAPFDCYRYYSDGLRSLAKWAELCVYHVSVAGVPRMDVNDSWVSEWNDAVLVARKQPSEELVVGQPFRFEKRMLPEGNTRLTYVDAEIAVEEITKKYSGNYILFGAGKLGEKTLSLIGEERVYCFIDNDMEKVGTMFHGKMVYSLDKIKSKCHNYNVLVTVNDRASCQIHSQLEKENIHAIDIYEAE